MNRQSATPSNPITTNNDFNRQNIPSQQNASNTVFGGVNPLTNQVEKIDDNRTSTMSSTRSEYGSSDESSRRSPHASQSSQRPVADKDAFIQPDSQRQWQSSISPAQRAKELASEMKQNIEERRRSSVNSGDEKILRIGGNKEFRI
ncbi:MAG: hypothetical protein EXX96DRAFT_556989, partial [Benjaminiella poitrasii]